MIFKLTFNKLLSCHSFIFIGGHKKRENSTPVMRYD